MGITAYALVLPLQETSAADGGSFLTPHPAATGEASAVPAPQTAHRTILLNIYLSNEKLDPGSSLCINATVQNVGQEEVLLEYFAGQLFEVVIRDEAGTPVYIRGDTGAQRYLMTPPLHIGLAPGESHTEAIEVRLLYSGGSERGNPLPPGVYTLTVYLTAAVQGHPSGVIDGIRAYTSASATITIEAR